MSGPSHSPRAALRYTPGVLRHVTVGHSARSVPRSLVGDSNIMDQDVKLARDILAQEEEVPTPFATEDKDLMNLVMEANHKTSEPLGQATQAEGLEAIATPAPSASQPPALPPRESVPSSMDSKIPSGIAEVIPSAAAAVDGSLEKTGTTSSVPTSSGHNRLQLIDEKQRFHTAEFHEHLEAWNMDHVGFGYDICAVLGSQSTGKSTLLNRLFGTNFDVMDERSRQQTTKGIWLCRGMDRNVLVMDVEGTDGRERGEDQDFERKSALFALSTAECLIVNMWENQVGLYQGANMGLLKTVLDVHLSLFQAGRARAGGAKEKTLLLFVIRDFIGTTPLSNLETTVRVDLQRIWASLTKPEALQDAELGDFFDLMFTTLPHKVLQAKEFDAGVQDLQRRFLDRQDRDYVFQTQYHKRIPIDGLPHYLESVWEQIVQNKDLDLPTQQELLAQFRCDEIAAAASSAFSAAVLALRTSLETGKVLPGLGEAMATHRAEALAMFDRDASRYHHGVYARQRNELLSKLNVSLWPFVQTQLKNMHVHLLTQFKHAMRDGVLQPSYNFGALAREAQAQALADFDAETTSLLLSDTDWRMDEQRAQLVDEIQATARTLRKEESHKVSYAIEKEMRRQMAEPLELALASPSDTMWDDVLKAFARVSDEAVRTFQARSESLNNTPDEEAETLRALQHAAWRLWLAKVQEQTSDAVLSMRLRGTFEDRFRYDAAGVPRVWKPTDDMDSAYVQARDATLALIPVYATVEPKDPTLIAPLQAASQAAVAAPDVLAHDDTPSWEEARQVLSELRCTELGQRLRKDADAYYLEAKRSTVSNMSQVPTWMYALLLVLGWNEMMAVLRNPLYFTLLCMVLAGVYVTWRLNLTTPVLTLAGTLTREVRTMVEDQLRQYLHPTPMSAGPVRAEAYEMTQSTSRNRGRTAAEHAQRPAAAVADAAQEPRLPASF